MDKNLVPKESKQYRLLACGLTCPVTHLLSPRPFLCERPLGIDYYSHGVIFFHGPLNLLDYVVISSTKPTGLFDVRAHIEYEVNDLVLVVYPRL